MILDLTRSSWQPCRWSQNLPYNPHGRASMAVEIERKFLVMSESWRGYEPG
jgi:hypothetical protein